MKAPKTRALLGVTLLIAAALITTPTWSQDLTKEATSDLLAQVRQMVIRGEIQDAYDALSPHEFQLAGDPDYEPAGDRRG